VPEDDPLLAGWEKNFQCSVDNLHCQREFSLGYLFWPNYKGLSASGAWILCTSGELLDHIRQWFLWED